MLKISIGIIIGGFVLLCITPIIAICVPFIFTYYVVDRFAPIKEKRKRIKFGKLNPYPYQSKFN